MHFLTMGYAEGHNDPFIELMRPPLDETPAQMMARRKREQDAQRISDRIDEQIKKDRMQSKKEKEVLKVLLLGQAESGEHPTCDLYLLPDIHHKQGKSTTLKSRVSYYLVSNTCV